MKKEVIHQIIIKYTPLEIKELVMADLVKNGILPQSENSKIVNFKELLKDVSDLEDRFPSYVFNGITLTLETKS